MAKKTNNFSDLGYVFSTDKNFEFDNEEEIDTLKPSLQNLEAVFSNKGRAGKTVSIVRGFIGNHEDLKNLAKVLKTKCGVGGSVKDGEIIIQGNYRDKIILILKELKYNVKRVGG
ncbi:MAG: translation initiation factor [Flavobacteriaceae bacterium]|nr:translation initiation factor [Flavobacteriaceae bacterium]